MKLSFKSKYKSITQFEPIDLSDFTVLTGLNGSGKSQLLEAIEQQKVLIQGHEDADNIVRFDYQTFRLTNEGPATAQQIATEKESAWQLYEKHAKANIESWKSGLGPIYDQAIDTANKNSKSLWQLSSSDFASEQEFVQFTGNYKKPIENHFRNSRHLQNNAQAQSIMSLVRILPCGVDELTKESFLDQFRPAALQNDFLPTEIGKAIWGYYIRSQENLIFEYQNRTHGTKNSVLSNEEFVKEYGPKPWDIFNGILEGFDTLDYKILSPEGTSHLDPYQLRLVHTCKEETEIGFADLSSGEKILMALVASVYKASADNRFPEVILLDEIDASLHPSMIKNLLGVIEDVFLARGIKVILVTHAPTTIALAPEESIFIMDSGIKKKTRADALSVLTEGYATLEEGIKLFDQVSHTELSILTEGKNTEYLKKAASYFAKNHSAKIDIITGVESDTGSNQLKTIFTFFSKLPHDQKVLFVWDCDVTYGLSDADSTFAYFLPKNTANTKVLRGIENMFPESAFLEKFYLTKPKDDGGTQKSLRKNDFKDHMINHGSETDFANFKPLFERVEEILTGKLAEPKIDVSD